MDSSPLDSHKGEIWSVYLKFSFYLFEKSKQAGKKFKEIVNTDIREAEGVHKVCLYCATLMDMDSSTPFWCCRGTSRPLTREQGKMQLVRRSCLHVQAVVQMCTGCVPAKLPSQTANDQSTLIAAALNFGFLSSGNTAKSRGKIISQQCLY